MEITIFAVMEETLKKALKTGIETLISVTEEVRHGLTVLDKDIQDLSRRVKESNTAEKANEKLDELVEKSVAAIKEYEQRATEISRKVQQHLAEVDPLARQSGQRRPGERAYIQRSEAEEAYAEQAQIDDPERAERDGNRDDVEGFKCWINDGRGAQPDRERPVVQCVDHGCIHRMWLGTYSGWRPGILPRLKLPAGLMRINECKREWFALW